MKIFLILFLSLLSFNLYSQDKITVDIHFGDADKSKQTYEVDWTEGLTVLTALQYLVPVETYPLENKYIFVSSIDGKKSEVMKSFWAYFLNGEKAHKIAATQLLSKGVHVSWEFRLNDQRQPEPIYQD